MHALEPAWETLKRDFDSACSHSAQQARRQIVRDLHAVFRRLRQYASESEWVSSVIDGASKFATHLALFTVENERLKLRGQQNLNLIDRLEFPVSSARAFATAIESRDAVVALRTIGEVGEALAQTGERSRAHLFPVTNAERVVAVLFAADDEMLDVSALELIAGMAAAVLERRSNQSVHSQIAPAPANGPAPRPENPLTAKSGLKLPPWSALNAQQRTLHVKAQRFSRVAVAEMQLARPEACRAGREQSNLYVFLQSEIDKAREKFRRQFLTVPSMVDYLHLELVQTAALGDERKLGADYPGQLV